MVGTDGRRQDPARRVPDREILVRLRREIAIRDGSRAAFAEEPLRTGCTPLDERLPQGGLARRALHEVAGPAATGFAVALAVRALAGGGWCVWCTPDARARERGDPYPPGLAALGLDHRRLLLVRCPDRRSLLWAMEEALRCPAVACVLGDGEGVDLRASRRLQLAAERGGGLGLLLGTGMPDPAPLAAATRLRVDPFFLPGKRAFLVDLWRVRGGAPWNGVVAWDGRTLSFALAAGLRDRTDATDRAAAG
ncbi:MAG TPA: hypothetical protein ENJ38_02530 [Rhodospirillales bacterium]|nr:hypothetical protein [Rhodospirillales bacterium]